MSRNKNSNLVIVDYDIDCVRDMVCEPEMKRKIFNEFKKWMLNADGSLDAVDEIIKDEWNSFVEYKDKKIINRKV